MAFRLESQGEPIPGYKLISRLGGGGFGEVWKASAPGGLLKAIKFVYGELQTSNDEGQRAEQELKAMSRVKLVRHPYILSLERFDIVDNQLMIVMELADRNLWDRFRECRKEGLQGIPREELLRYLDESAEALDLMNIEHQLQHLDIKPQNIFLVHNHVKVADFGLVKDLEGMAASVTGGVTPVYAAPETFDGWVSRYCDQYSLAILYQELLVGQRPFAGTNVRQLIVQHMQGTPNVEPLPPGDRDAVNRALSKSPDSRFPTCTAFVQALRANVGGNSSAKVIAPGGSASVSDTPSRSGTQVAPAEKSRNEGADGEAAARPTVREITGEGALMPSLVVGLGQMGLSVLHKFRECLKQRIGPAELLPSLRLLYVDVDPDAVRTGMNPKQGGALTGDEILQIRLNRPHHYLRSRDVRASIESWFNAKMIYRIPRNLVTNGVRALGRLAFFDNYRQASRKLSGEVEAGSRGDALQKSLQLPDFALRTNQPRIYVIASLAGGAGSGMFLDVAYVLRATLRRLGYSRSDQVGVLFLPPLDRNLATVLPMGNTFAALTELNHFSTPGNAFTAKYEEKEGKLSDPGPPFERCVLLPTHEKTEDRPDTDPAGRVADYLFRDLFTSLGRTADSSRRTFLQEHPIQGGQSLSCQTFGCYRMSWPRRQLSQRVARHLCKRLIQRWISKDAAPVKDAVRQFVSENWAKVDFTPEKLIGRLQEGCEKALEQPPEALFAAITDPLVSLQGLPPEQQFNPIRQALKQLDDILGRPEGTTGVRATAIMEGLSDTSNTYVKDWGKKLADLATGLVEHPEFRLAGAEEAVRQFVAQLEKVLGHYEPLNKELNTRVQDSYARITSLLANPAELLATGRRATTLLANAVELMRLYPKWRYQSMVLQQLISTYVSIRGHMSDQLREVNFCRARLIDLQRNFENPITTGDADFGQVRNYYPAGCRNLDEAVTQVLQMVTAVEMTDLDNQLQGVIREQFTALTYVCMTSANLVSSLEMAMQLETERFVSERLGGANVAEMFLSTVAHDDEAMQVLADAFAKAAPRLPGLEASPEKEFCLVAVPPGPAGEKVAELAKQVLGHSRLAFATSPDDIIVYREVPYVKLQELEHLGPFGCEAYEQMTSHDNFTPHSRVDIREWQGFSPR